MSSKKLLRPLLYRARAQSRPSAQGEGVMSHTHLGQLRLLASPAAPLRLLDQLAAYEDYLIGEQRRLQGRARYLWTLKRYFAWLGEEATHADVNAISVQRYKENLGKRGCAGSTVINALAAIRDFSVWALFEGYRYDDPTLGIKRPPKRPLKPNPLYPDEVAILMAAIEHQPPAEGTRARWYWQRNRLAVLLFLYTGLRLSELAALRWSDLHLRAGVLDVRAGSRRRSRSCRTSPSWAGSGSPKNKKSLDSDLESLSRE
jgi:site-specific recombinase XerD